MTSTPGTRMLRGIFEHIDQGLREEGIPLTDEQRAFLFNGVAAQEASIR